MDHIDFVYFIYWNISISYNFAHQGEMKRKKLYQDK